MNIKKSSKQVIKRAAKIIQAGGLVSFPTETVYGLGANALDPLAVAGIFEVKNRPFFDPLIIHVASMDMFEKKTGHVPEKAYQLIEKFWPGPLTLVVEKSELVPDIVTAGLSTVAVRMPAHPVALDLIKECDLPIAAPSANPFGYISPTTAFHVEKQLKERVDLIIDGGPCKVGVESTIVRIDRENAYLLRPGGVSSEMIESVIGKLNFVDEVKELPDAPGLLKSHYAPRARVVIITEGGKINENTENCGLIAFKRNNRKQKFKHIIILSKKGDLCRAAAVLFSALHTMDGRQVKRIFIEEVPEIGLGKAIMNRLRKASAEKNN